MNKSTRTSVTNRATSAKGPTATVGEQLNRIVQLVAELTRRKRDGGPRATLTDLAVRFGVTVAQVERDVRTLTLLDNDSDADWLLSLRVSQQGDTMELNSRGPFRRPVRFTPDELLALSAGLATEDGGAGLAARFAAATRECVSLERYRSPGLDCLLDAVTNNVCVEIRYAGEAAKSGASRVIHPHQVAAFAGRIYVVRGASERTTGGIFVPTGSFTHVRSTERLSDGTTSQPSTVPTICFRSRTAVWTRCACASLPRSRDGCSSGIPTPSGTGTGALR